MDGNETVSAPSLQKYLLPLWAVVVLILAWFGVRFSPGFSETFAACFVTAQILALLGKRPVFQLVGMTGALLLLVCTMIYAAGDDRLTACVLASLAGTALYAVFRAVTGRGKKGTPAELLLCLTLAAAGVFAVACGIFSTALLPLGIGALLCLGSRHLNTAGVWLTLIGLTMCDLFLIAPMCFPGGV